VSYGKVYIIFFIAVNMKKRYSLLFSAIVIFFFLYVLRGIEFREVYELFKTINLYYFLAALLCAIASLLFWNLRWQNSLNKLAKVNFFFLLKILFAGLFLNTITPGAGIGGEPLRAYLLREKYHKPMSKFFGAILADKFLHFLAYSGFLIFSLFYILFFFKINVSSKIFFFLLLIGILVILYITLKIIFSKKRIRTKLMVRTLYFFKFIKRRFTNIEIFNNYIDKRSKNIHYQLRSIIGDKKKLIMGIIYSIFFWILRFYMFYFLFLSFGIQVSYVLIIVVVSVSMVFGDISPLPGGVGLLEGVIFLLFSAIGIVPELALSVALLSRVIILFNSIFLGGICLLSIRLEERKTKMPEVKN